MNISLQNLTGRILLVIIIFLSCCIEELIAQTSEVRIRAVRDASNAALKALDEEANFELLTDDELITTGSGVLLSGKT